MTLAPAVTATKASSLVVTPQIFTSRLEEAFEISCQEFIRNTPTFDDVQSLETKRHPQSGIFDKFGIELNHTEAAIMITEHDEVNIRKGYEAIELRGFQLVDLSWCTLPGGK